MKTKIIEQAIIIDKPTKVFDIIVESEFVKTKSKTRRLIKQGSVKVDGLVIDDFDIILIPMLGYINDWTIQIGKKKFICVYGYQKLMDALSDGIV